MLSISQCWSVKSEHYITATVQEVDTRAEVKAVGYQLIWLCAFATILAYV